MRLAAESRRVEGDYCGGWRGAAHLPGMLAAKTLVPVLGVPVPSTMLQGMDSLLSIVQMPKGVPVATFAIGRAGAANAGLFAVEMLASGDQALRVRLSEWRSGAVGGSAEPVGWRGCAGVSELFARP